MKPLDLLVTGVKIADVVRLRLFEGWVGIRQGQFQYVEPGHPPAGLEARQVLDGAGQIMAPGLIDAHMHIESSLLTPRRFAQAVLPHGTTAVLADPHEIGNVLGEAGVRWMIEASRGLPLEVFTAIPSCIPATDETLETALGVLGAAEVDRLAGLPGVIALGELMDYQGLAAGSARLEGIIAAARRHQLLLEGHTPTLGGTVLSDYAAHGITSDHTLSTPDKLLEQLSKGFTVMLQAKSLNAEVVQAVQALPDRSRVLLVTDDVMPNRLTQAHLSGIYRRALELGWEPLDALASATLRPASYLRQPQLGLIAPGRQATFVLLSSLENWPPNAVYVRGQLVASQGQSTADLAQSPPLPKGGEIIRPLPARLSFGVADGTHTVRLMAMNQINTFTLLDEAPVAFADGWPLEEHNLAVVAVLTRQGDQPAALGLLKGLGLRQGAFASSLAHDSHPLIAVGRDPQLMTRALEQVRQLGGGMVFVTSQASYSLSLPIAGLISDAPLEEVAPQFEAIEAAIRAQGVTHLNPVLFLTLLALTVSPTVKMSDRGLVDVEARRLVSLFV